MGATNFAMLGLGDIVIPGIFIALLLRLEEILDQDFFLTSNFADTTTA